MLIKFFTNGKGGGSAPVDYLTAEEVIEYDELRNPTRDESGDIAMTIRDPLPEILRGNPDHMIGLIDACPHQWTYRAGVIAFTEGDNPSEEEQQDVIDKFEALAFAGLEGDQYSCLWVRHSHEGNIELHFCTPRMELRTGKSLNIAPPGYGKAFNSLRDVCNKQYGWGDPMDKHHAQEIRPVLESPERAVTREEINNWIVGQIANGAINNREEMISELKGVGFEIPRAGKKYITVKAPEQSKGFRLKGEIYEHGWTREQTLEQINQSQYGREKAQARRLDLIGDGETRQKFEQYCSRRAEYNQGRYGGVQRSDKSNDRHDEIQREDGRASDQNITLGDFYNSGAVDDELSWDQLVLGQNESGNTEQQIIFGDGLGDDDIRGKADRIGTPRERKNNSLHIGQKNGSVHREEITTYETAQRTNINGLGARASRLRERINISLGSIRQSLTGFGEKHSPVDRQEVRQYNESSRSDRSISNRISDWLTGLSERVAGLRRDRSEAEQQLGASLQRGAKLEESINTKQNEQGLEM